MTEVPHHHKPPPDWEFWDWNSILRTLAFVLFVAVIVFVVMYGGDFYRSEKGKKLDMATIADLVSIKKNYTMSEGRTGNTYSLNSIVVEYKYTIGENSYTEKDAIVLNSPKDIVFVNKLLEADYKTVPIQYSSKDPAESQISIQ